MGDKYLHKLFFLHFSNSTKNSDITGKNYENMKAKDITCNAV